MFYDPRELATVLAALRCFQDELRCHTLAEIQEFYPQLENEPPLTIEEISALCERINAPEDDGNLCDCEVEVYFCAGVPGVLAHLENGRVAPGAKVERCDQCLRFPSDSAALAKLHELGIAGGPP